ncbi:alpha/beta fold hydrolase [Sphingobium sp. CFD-2]|uniref:alpha/beta fold hydrolase n=1 Tax=Sphingobium sp. CFD-2 TaxID=2878542 RepID=UPI00214ADEF9|nr:alpha/beta fold hydrolase [Sphingobium sp. CFD-2]
MYVEKLTPIRARQPYPIILIHGGSATASYWTDTPDGREGWAQYFVAQGFVVYLVDQPARGRSAWQEGLDGKLHVVGAEAIEQLFTQPEAFDLWPQARLHTQFPDGGLGHSRIGDPIFDQFYASIVPYLSNNAETQRLSRDAVAALLDRIGPAVLLTHSDSGPIGWLVADARPDLVRGIVAVEPKRQRLEDLVPAMIDALEGWSVAVKRRREERAEQKRQWEEQDRKRKDIERQVRVEGYRIKFLQRQVERKREIDGLAGLIELWGQAENPDPRFAELLDFAGIYQKWLEAKLAPEAIAKRIAELKLMDDDVYIWDDKRLD